MDEQRTTLTADEISLIIDWLEEVCEVDDESEEELLCRKLRQMQEEARRAE